MVEIYTESTLISRNRSENHLCKMNESMVHVFALKSKNFRLLYRDTYHLACFFKSFLHYELLVHKTLHQLKLLSKKKPLVTLWARHLVLKHIVASLFTPCLFYVEGIFFGQLLSVTQNTETNDHFDFQIQSIIKQNLTTTNLL